MSGSGVADFKTLLTPGETRNINVQGNFVYCKLAENPTEIVINGKRTVMESGDKLRFDREFDKIEILNPDELRPAFVILTVGFGDFNRQIIQGEITVAPGIRTASGEFVADSSAEFSGVILAEYAADARSFANGDRIADTENHFVGGAVPYIEILPGKIRVHLNNLQNRRVFDYSADSLKFIGEVNFAGQGNTSGIPFTPTGIFYDIETLTYGSPGEIYRYNQSAGSYDLLRDNDASAQSYAYDDDFYYLVTSGIGTNYAILSRADGSEIERGSLEAQGQPRMSRINYNPAEKRFYGIESTAGTSRLYRANSFKGPYEEVAQGVSGEQTTRGLAYGENGRYASVREGPDYFYADRQAVFPITITGTLRLVPECSPVGLLRKSTVGDFAIGDLSFSYFGGKSFISGEIIRNVLALVRGVAPADDYMDSVTGFRATPLGGNTRLAFEGNGSTLARLGVEDDLQVSAPFKFKLRVRQ